MIRLLLIGLIIYFFYTLVRTPKYSRKNQTSNEIEPMVECFSCETFISKDEALNKNGNFYCSQKCMDEQ